MDQGAYSDHNRHDEEPDATATQSSLERANTMVVSSPSQEFRSSLALMLGSLEKILARSDQWSAEDRAEADVIREQASRLLTLASSPADPVQAERGDAVHELTRAQAALRASEEKFTIAFRHSPLALTIAALATGKLVDVNEAFVRLSGYTRDEVLGRTPEDLNLWVDPKQRTDGLVMLRSGGHISDLEARFRTKHGSILTGMISATLIDIDGQPHVLSSVVDITIRKQAEMAARASEARLAHALEAADMVAWEVVQGNLTLSSNAAALLGSDIAGASMASEGVVNIHPDDRAEKLESFQRALKQKTDYHAVYRFLNRDRNEWRWLEDHGRVYYTDGQAIGISGVTQDITVRKQQEEQHHEAEEKFRLFIDHAPAAVAMFDREMRYLAVSRRWIKHYNIPKDVIGHCHYDVFPEISERWKAIHARCLAGAIEKSDEDRFDRRDGSVEWLKWEIHPWFNSSGEIGGIMIFAEDITERKLAEQRLRASEERLRLATEAAGIFSWETDLRADTIMWSENTARIIGCATSDLPNTIDGAHFFVTPEDSAQLNREFEAVLRHSASSYTFEFRGIGPDHTTRYWQAQGGIRYDVDGTPVQVFGVTQDITERKRVEEALRQERALLEVVLRQLPEGVVIAEAPSGKLILGNEQVDRIWQHEFVASENVDQYTVYKGFHADGRPYLPHEWPIARTVATGEVVAHEEIRFQRGTGSFGWMVVNSVPIRDAHGNISAAVATFADITDRKEAEERVRESEARLAAFMENSPGSLFIKDAAGRYTLVNGAFLTAIGKTFDDVIGTTDAELFPPDMAKVFMAEDREVRESGEPRRFEETFVYGGRQYSFLSHKFPLPDGSIGCVGTDITERKVVEIALHQSEQRLQVLYAQEQAARAAAEEASRLKDEFLATVSHELRTPLTSILGYGQLLQARPRDEAYIARTVARMVQSARVQSQLIEDLLDVSRIVSGKLRIEMQPIDFIDVVRAALDTVRPTVEAKQLHLQIELDPAASTITGDANRLQQVVWNLLSNAAKFTPFGGTIMVQLQVYHQAAQLIVRDTGQGISPSFLPYVFDRFRQADGTSTRSSGGLGLGLAIARHLVELHGGTVQAASDGEGRGATFTIRLPLVSLDDATRHTTHELWDHTAQTCPPELRGLRVLLVDDQHAILELLEEILTPCGVTTRVAERARDALDVVREWKPDVLVSDIAMPNEDGYWLIHQIRALPEESGGSIQAIALTAYVRVEEHMRVLAAGFQRYVPKPVEPNELRAVVASLVQDARA